MPVMLYMYDDSSNTIAFTENTAKAAGKYSGLLSILASGLIYNVCKNQVIVYIWCYIQLQNC